MKRLRFTGVRLFTLAEGEIGELHVGLKGTMNALFQKDLADKTRRGSKAVCGKDDWLAGCASVMTSSANTMPSASRSTVAGPSKEAEAVIVRRIFAEFASGSSCMSDKKTAFGEGPIRWN